MLFGPRVSFWVGKLRPFAEALFGVGHVGIHVGSNPSFATGVGGNDYRIFRPIALRFEGVYIDTRFFSTTQNNVRLSTGIVFAFEPRYSLNPSCRLSNASVHARPGGVLTMLPTTGEISRHSSTGSQKQFSSRPLVQSLAAEVMPRVPLQRTGMPQPHGGPARSQRLSPAPHEYEHPLRPLLAPTS